MTRSGARFTEICHLCVQCSGIEVLFLCTANQSRSPMAAELLRTRLAARGVSDVAVGSAGLLPGGAPATAGARASVPGLDGHVSRRLTSELLRRADLVIGLCREHVHGAAVLQPAVSGRCFTLKELVRRATESGPRRADEPLPAWLRRVGASPGPPAEDGADDVADPTGCLPEVWSSTVAVLDDLTARLVDLVWPVAER